MTERLKRIRPSGGGWADRQVARLARQPTWVVGGTVLAAGGIVCALAALTIPGVPWHELLAWFLVGALFAGALALAAIVVATRGRSLVEEAHSRRDLMDLDWTHFEELVGQVFRAKGWTVAQTQREADGGADLVLTRRGERGLVECKQWRQEVDVLRVRAFYGVMAAEKVRAGYFVTTSFFTPEAERFANEVGIHLIAGSALLRELATVRGDTPSNGENETPRCPLCGSTMRLATGRFGPFWGCSRFPDECKGWLRLGQTEPTDLAMVPVSGGGPP